MATARRSRVKMTVQMKDVAAKAGVSITTVSHIVNETRDVAPDTRERVLQVMRELKYHKNAFGRRLARGRSDSYGLIISEIENPFFPELIKTFELSVLDHGCDVLLCTTAYDGERARKAVTRMLENKVLGVAVMTSQLDSALIEELDDADIPLVRLDAPEPASSGHSGIRVDYSVGAREAAAHLKELGHKRIAFITGPQNRISAATYRQAFLDAIEQLGLSPARIIEGTNDMDGGAAGVQTLLTSAARPTAILCGNDLAALGAMRALAEAGLRVPEDVSVIGADDIAFARYSVPALTTIRVPRDQLGRLAFEALERMVRTKYHLASQRSIETHLVIRQSTGPAPGSAKRQRRSGRD